MEYKRQYRELEPETKQKISDSTKGKKKTEQHKEHIRQALIDYWRQVPHKPVSGETDGDITTYHS